MKTLIEVLRWLMLPVMGMLLVLGSVFIVLAGILVPVRLGGVKTYWWPDVTIHVEQEPAE